MYENTHGDREGITAPDITRLAEGLLEAQGAGGHVKPPSATHGLRLEDAYRVGSEIARRRMKGGWRLAGWKVGLTNREIWQRWGLDRPIIAPVYRETVFRVPGEAQASPRADAQPGPAGPARLSVPMGTRAAPRLEVEVVFGFAGSSADPAWVALGVELVDCHYSGWKFDPADGVADFGLHAALIVGPRVLLLRGRPGAADSTRSAAGSTRSAAGSTRSAAGFARSLPQMAVALSGDGEALARGRGDAVLGSPFHVLAELHGSLGPAIAVYPAPEADSREAGHSYLVSTGTLTPLVEARIGTTYRVEADQLPSFSFVLV
ncbi:MAG: hypothetical protein OXH51_02755 [Gemmatimonadetes bacterium]|nr:hypothetical protein [Gemmatimonadota bacterium]